MLIAQIFEYIEKCRLLRGLRVVKIDFRLLHCAKDKTIKPLLNLN